MMLELPPEEDRPTWREGFDVEHAWKLRHIDIMFARHGRRIANNIGHGSNCVPHDQLIRELVIIGRNVHQALGHPPTFSFRPYLYGQLEKDIRRMLRDVSQQLGWMMV